MNTNTLKKLELMQFRNFSDLFSVTTNFIKQNFKLYIKTILTYSFPFMVLASLSLAFIFRNFKMGDVENMDSPDFFNSENIISNIALGSFSFLFFMIALFALMTITFAFVKMYQSRDDFNLLKPNDIWQESKKSLGWMIGYSLLFFLIFIVIYIGFVASVVSLSMYDNAALSIILGIISFIAFLFMIYSVIPLSLMFPLKYEKPQLGFLQIIKKSFKLVKGKWWYSFGFFFIFQMLVSIVTYIFIIPIYALGFVLMLLELGNIAKFASIFSVGLFYSLALITSGFVYIALSILFYSLYERLTGKNLSEQIQSIGTNNPNQNAIEGI